MSKIEVPRRGETYSEWLRRVDRKRKARLAVRMILAAVLSIAAAVLIAVSCNGCATGRVAEQPPIVLSERAGSLAAEAIGQLTGQVPKAMTIPGWRIVVFQPKDADDECLLVHERTHVLEQVELGGPQWLLEYVTELRDCANTGMTQAQCLRQIPQEDRAYRAQHACQDARR